MNEGYTVSAQHINTPEAGSSVPSSYNSMMINGCHVKVFFRETNNPTIRRDIARLFLTTFFARVEYSR